MGRMKFGEALERMSGNIARHTNGGELISTLSLVFPKDAQIDLSLAGMLEMHLRKIPRKLSTPALNQTKANLICMVDVFLRRSV